MAQTLYALYRISDKGHVKAKLPHADRFHCLRNFIDVFGTDGLTVFADNCAPDTLATLQQYGVPIVTSALGNADSFLAVLDFALQHYDDADAVYFVEDDYLHKAGARALLLEGLAIADYVTLYDHPDKYVDFGKGSLNPFVSGGGEDTKVLLTHGSHWKRTNSTTMTFAARVGVMRADYGAWSQFKTHDHVAFHRLTGGTMSLGTSWRVLKNRLTGSRAWDPRGYRRIAGIITRQIRDTLHQPARTLVVCLPARATHTELKWLAPLTDWSRV